MGNNEIFIHPSAVVHPQANLGSGVYIGPSVVIGSEVSIHENTRVDAFVYIKSATIGADCHIFPYSTIGTEPQDISYKGEETYLKIGDRNIFREFMTVHRGTVKGGGKTSIGDDNYFMAYSHIAHDCFVGNKTVFNHGATIGGHCYVGDFVQVGALSGMHQFCRIGKYAFTGGYSVITQDVLPFSRVAGSRPPLFYGLNAIGLRRQGFSRDRIRDVKGMFKIIFYSKLNTSQAVERILSEYPQGEDRDEIIQFIKSSKRGIIKKASQE